MKILCSDLFFVVDSTPDYISVLGLATSIEEATKMMRNEVGSMYNPVVLEVSLGDILQTLLNEGKAKERWVG